MDKKNSYTIGGAMVVLGLIILLVIAPIANNNSPYGSHLAPGVSKSGAYMFPIIILGIGVLFLIQGFRKAKAEKAEEERIKEAGRKRFEEEVRKRKTIRTGDVELVEEFYRKCVSEGIKNVETTSNIERLMLYAKRNNIEGTKEELINSFNKGKDIATHNDNEKEIVVLKEKEEKLRAENKKYINCFGRDKYIQICKEKIKENELIISECRKDKDYTVKGGSSLYQKEHDWAIAGGLASGVAGGAAGVATAIDSQIQNANIRANNQAVSELIFASIDQINKKKWDAEKSKEIWEKKLSQAEKLLVEERDGNELIKLLDFEILEKKKSATGAVIVKIKIKQQPFKIFDDVDAKVDGSIKVIINNSGKKVGEGIFVMREDLLGYPIVICDPICDISEPFDIVFAPNILWAIEKIL